MDARPLLTGGPGEGQLPDKIPGEHRWVAMAIFTVTAGQLAAAQSGARVNLDHGNRIGLQAGCLDCELPYEQARGTRCTAAAYDWNGASS